MTNCETNGGSSYTTYFYGVNAQGDVEKIFRMVLNSDTGLYEEKIYGLYTYDVWGNVTATTAAGNAPSATSLVVRNPIRYRGYVYDNETGFYYLQSRYYDPANRRFINADGYASTGQGFTGTNMFAYCLNNPVIYADHNGKDVTVTIYSETETYTTSGGIYTVTVTLKKTYGADTERQIEIAEDSMSFTFSEGPGSFGAEITQSAIEPNAEVTFYEAETPYGTIAGSVSLSGVGVTQTIDLGRGYFLEESVTFTSNPNDTGSYSGELVRDPLRTYDGDALLGRNANLMAWAIAATGVISVCVGAIYYGSQLRTQKT